MNVAYAAPNLLIMCYCSIYLMILGFVNKKGPNHIGILVHKAFNVSVPKPDRNEQEEAEDVGENHKEWPGDKVKVGQEVKFTLDKIDYKSRLPYIRGSLHEEYAFFFSYEQLFPFD